MKIKHEKKVLTSDRERPPTNKNTCDGKTTANKS